MIKKTIFKISKKHRYPLRPTIELILQRDLGKIKNKRILEIGCGKWDYAKKILEKNKNQWTGLEPVDFKKDNITPIKGSVKRLPFHNNSFDYILCNQTMEHWFEYGVSFKKALKEINRILKIKGTLMVNVPIHNHGHPYFLRGDLKKIIKLFKKNWKISLIEKCFPSIKHQGWKTLSQTGWQSKIQYPNFLIPNSKNKFSYILNLHLIKNEGIKNKEKRSLFRRIKVVLKFIKELALYPF